MYFSLAAVPDLIQEFHLPGVLLPHIAQVQAQDRIALHPTASQFASPAAERFQAFRTQIPRQTIFGFNQRNLFLQAAGYLLSFTS